MKTYSFKVVVEPDEGGYHAFCPALRRFGAVTQGATEEEALRNINEVVHMIVRTIDSSLDMKFSEKFLLRLTKAARR